MRWAAVNEDSDAALILKKIMPRNALNGLSHMSILHLMIGLAYAGLMNAQLNKVLVSNQPGPSYDRESNY